MYQNEYAVPWSWESNKKSLDKAIIFRKDKITLSWSIKDKIELDFDD